MSTDLGKRSVSASGDDPPSTEAGKWRRMTRLADEAGRFAMLAVDQRTSLKRMLNGGPNSDEVRRSLRTLKRAAAASIAPLGTAVLMDPIYGYPHTLDVIPAGTGLILAVEVSGYTSDHGRERRSQLLDDFDTRSASGAGADAVKLLIWHHPEASTETMEHQRKIVRRVGGDCRAVGMPFILEIVDYTMGAPRSSPEYVRRKPEHVLDGVRTYGAEEFGVDLFKVPFPADLKFTQEYGEASFAGGTVLFDKAEVEEHCRELDEAASAPWVILSAGVDPDEFIENVKIANEAGASGFLCGRAVWKDAVAHLPDERSVAAFMSEHGCARFRRIRSANTDARPWYERTRLSPCMDAASVP